MAKNTDLLRGAAGPIVLKLLQERSMYGYEIIKEVNIRTNGAFTWKEGTLYPCLHHLQAEGLIAGKWQLDGAKPRKYYTLTPEGAAEAPERIRELKECLGTIHLLMSNV